MIVEQLATNFLSSILSGTQQLQICPRCGNGPVKVPFHDEPAPFVFRRTLPRYSYWVVVVSQQPRTLRLMAIECERHEIHVLAIGPLFGISHFVGGEVSENGNSGKNHFRPKWDMLPHICHPNCDGFPRETRNRRDSSTIKIKGRAA